MKKKFQNKYCISAKLNFEDMMIIINLTCNKNEALPIDLAKVVNPLNHLIISTDVLAHHSQQLHNLINLSKSTKTDMNNNNYNCDDADGSAADVAVDDNDDKSTNL